jgi:hypothetical protein
MALFSPEQPTALALLFGLDKLVLRSEKHMSSGKRIGP